MFVFLILTLPAFFPVLVKKNQLREDIQGLSTQPEKKSQMLFIDEYQSDLEIVTMSVLIDMPWHSSGSS